MHSSDPVNRVMTESVLTVSSTDPVTEALRLFACYPVHHLPVVDDGRVVGMLSSADVAKLTFFLPPPGAARDFLVKDRWQVCKIMRAPAITVSEHESVQRSAELMATHGIHALPVVNGKDFLVGILTTTDLMHGWLTTSSFTTPAHGSEEPVISPDSTLVSSLRQVAHAAKRLLNAGPDERLHAELQKAVDRADSVDDRMKHRSAPDLCISG